MKNIFLKCLGVFSGVAVVSIAGVGGASMGGDPAPRLIRACKTGTPLELDGDLAKWRGANSLTLEGRPLAGHARSVAPVIYSQALEHGKMNASELAPRLIKLERQ